jgi:hypothetical protein
MSAHYLIDLYGNPLGSARILDVRNPSNDQSLSNGSFVVRVPDGVQVVNPTDLTDLLTKKYVGLLAFYTGFTRISFDDLTDASGVNTAPGTSSALTTGLRGSVGLYPTAGARVQSVVTPLTPAQPTVCVVTFETFRYTSTDDKNDRYQRTYEEIASSPSSITCSVSFNGGATFLPTTEGAVLNIPLADQGTNFVIRLTNVSGQRLFLGSWAVIY